MKTCVPLPVPLAIATIWLLCLTQTLIAQTENVSPAFRPRTDTYAARDLQLLRDELNKATDVDGDVNPLSRFLNRNAESAQRARIEIGPSGSDDEAQRRPTIDPKPSERKPAQTIGILPGPRYTMIQQPSSYIANYQEPPGSGAYPSSAIPPRGFPNPSGFSTNSNPILPDGSSTPVLPFSGSALPPSYSGGPTTYSSPIPNSNLGNNPAAIVVPGTVINPPFNYQPQPNYPNAPMVVNPGLNGVPLRSPSDSIMTSPQRYSPIVNGAPFVSPQPCQFDANYMVSPRVYRQAVDPCAQPLRGAPSTYAPSPYATQPSGSPFSYVPPTGMPYNSNGYNSGYRPLFGFGQSLANAYTGRGIIGQPVAYVDGQPVRNFIRYLFP